MPLVRDSEPGRAADVWIETAKTEPPRRITRGELPVVMGRLIDQVEDPMLKAALENPVNPNEPKGLGTAATRDTILPKLQKSQYVDLLKGKDPPIQVTEVGLAFIAAVRRVFPSYGDPVGRAMFEADLAEIGRAFTTDEAVRRAASYQERTRARVQELIGAIARSQTVAVDPTTVPVSFALAEKPPTKAMIAFSTSLAARKGLKLPRGLKSNAAICRSFLDQHAPARSSEAGEHWPQNGPRPPSEAMVRYARALAEEHGVECPPAIATDFAACRAFLDEHASRHAMKAEDGSKTTTRKNRSPAVASDSPRKSRTETPATKRSIAAKGGSTRGRARARPASPTQPSG
ncbi:DNA topoisomerase [Microvirga pakistanensis]|uniref:DNA topoisomerase n=1 Tax=Microvirga pakistanensis TaxID=1682650 RepID=UPI00313D2135